MKAREVALKALALDQDLAEAHATLGWVHFSLDWDWEAAQREFKRAIQINPSYGHAHQLYTVFLSTMGRHEEALAEAERGITVDPLSPTTQWNKGVALLAARRSDEAMAQNRRVLELDPSYMEAYRTIGELHAEKGRVREAAEAFQQAGISHRPFVLAYLGVAHARAGHRERRDASSPSYNPPPPPVTCHRSFSPSRTWPSARTTPHSKYRPETPETRNHRNNSSGGREERNVGRTQHRACPGPSESAHRITPEQSGDRLSRLGDGFARSTGQARAAGLAGDRVAAEGPAG